MQRIIVIPARETIDRYVQDNKIQNLCRKPSYLLIDEIDKMSDKDQAMLLNLMEPGIVSETKHNKTRTAHMKTSVFATSNNVSNIITPLQSRFFVIELPPYTYEQFYQISVHLLTKGHKVSHDIAKNIPDKAWANSRNIRDCVSVGRMASAALTFIVNRYILKNARRRVLVLDCGPKFIGPQNHDGTLPPISVQVRLLSWSCSNHTY